MLIAVLLQLPMCMLAFHFVRIPLDGLIQQVLLKGSDVYKFTTVFYAPLTEELAKLYPLLLPWFYKKITEKNFIWIALSLGLGFGLGEIWLVASFIEKSPELSVYPWYMYTGFINERFMVCAIHGAFTAVALKQLHKKFIIGILFAMALHFTGNFPIYLSKINFPAFGATSWQIILQIWVILFFFVMIALLSKIYYGKFQVGKFLFGISVCPECSAEYPSPVWAINLLHKRYEKCPHCKKWHIVSVFKKESQSPSTY